MARGEEMSRCGCASGCLQVCIYRQLKYACVCVCVCGCVCLCVHTWQGLSIQCQGFKYIYSAARDKVTSGHGCGVPGVMNESGALVV
mmetsp:Transcript_24259/g.53033  ORF Transcript_24259/g.53033 Transcript_24259/m.53033 type:complete len:87 (+) Transcript_24259:1100-1360(+)